ncbi:SIS domain-containing protein [Arthrobacter russicus]|uniref:Fructoselysine-6-P-deglycase FrlB-like protein n=1 Tax=Arthrobacter russicus TaxID=172040 RepID=A0ABU1J886_9MICC|nr:sugar isomerase [Arthrobacter russicus]MDR6268635.1 fructoselysine-6-P-deglycase FrlB-like protein [Arthrobacter russicus]
MTDYLVRTGAFMEAELRSQPDVWEQAIAQSAREDLLPPHGAKVAVVGCGTSWFMAQSYAAAREAAGLGLTDAYAASEANLDRDYDAIIALTRSGTTTEVLEILRDFRGKVPTTLIVGDTSSPAVELADTVIGLSYADEKSVVQTRFATAALSYLLSSLGLDLTLAVAQARQVLDEELAESLIAAEQFTFLGRGWTIGLAHEAGLKMREAVQGWTESYPAMEYRHGPISIAAPGRATWIFGPAPVGLAEEVARTGAEFLGGELHPLAELVKVHQLTLERARVRGLDPDLPRHLSRSVILDD